MDTAQSSRQSSAGTGHYHHGHNNHPQHHNTQQQQIKGPEYALDTYIPQNSTVAPHQNNGYYQQPEPPRSNPGSPSKRVAFKGLPNQYNQHPGQHPGNAGKNVLFVTSNHQLTNLRKFLTKYLPYSCKQKHVLLFRKSEFLFFKVSNTNMPHIFF